MRVVVKRCGYDIVVMQLDNTGCCSLSHEIRTIMRISDQTMGISHFVCTVPDEITLVEMQTIVAAFAAGLESAGADRGSDYDRVCRASGRLRINLAPFFGCN